MKKIYFFLFTLTVLTSQLAFSQCTNGSAFGTTNAPTNNVPVTITTCAFGGEYSTVNNCVAGSTYQFSATGGTGNFLTIHQGTPGGTVLGFGTSPVSVLCTASGPLYLHYNTNAACGTDFSCHTGVVQCTSCPGVVVPANDLCVNAIPINCGQSISGSTVAATIDVVPTCVTTLSSAPGVWYTFTGDGSAVTLSLCTGTTYDSKIGVFSGSCAGLVCVTGNDDFCGLQSQVAFATTAGTQYFILVTGFSTATGAFTLTRSCIPPNDACANAININCGQTISATTVGATADIAPACSVSTQPGIWYRFTGVGGTETISTCAGGSFDTKLSVYTGTCAALTCVAGNDDFCGLLSQVSFATTPGTTYFILVHGFGGATGTFSLTRTCPPPCAGVPSPGSISGPGAAVCAGVPVNLSISGYTNASGLTFQWKSSSTPGGPYNNIPGATNTTYSFTAASTAYYIVTVTCNNPGGGAANTVEFPVRVSNLVHSNVLATPNVVCSPGATVISGTVSGSAVAGNYTHTLTGPGTIGAAVPSGTNNSNVSFSVSGLPAGVQSFTLTSTDPAGCSVATVVSVTVNQTPVVTISTTPPVTGTPCTENFDAVTAPALPGGWTASVGASCAGTARWVTTNTLSVSAPNSAFVNDPNCISDEYLDSKPYTITSAVSQLTFSRSNNLENNFDGLVLEISMSAGPFTDIITAGGSFVAGGYNATISTSFGSPIGGRPAWTGNSGGFVTTTVNLPAAANGQTVVLRWRRATDNSVSGVGANIDNVTITNAGCGAVTVCNGSIVRIDAQGNPGSTPTFTSLANTHIPAGGTTTGPSLPYPNAINVSGLVPPGVTVRSVTLNSYSHTLPDDVDIVLVSPNGQAVILMSDAGGSTPATGQTFTFSDAAATTLADNAFNPSGTYKPTNYGAGDNWPAPGPLGAPSSTTLSTFTGPANGNWNLYVFDDQVNETGFIATWSMTFNVPAPVVFSPLTNLFTDAAATIAYTGTPLYTVWAKPTAVNSTYTATSTVNGCNGSASVDINLIFPPVITVQPSPATQTVCPGFNVVYSVTATGPGLTYQWRKNGVNLVNAGFISGVNTNTLTISTVSAADAGSYDVVVSGTCAPPAISNAVVLIIATPPTITTQPVNQIVCVGTNAIFSVVVAGVPTPNIFQWQSSPDGVIWTDLTTNGSYTATLTVPNPTQANNGLRYRVRITNNCGGGFIFSNVVTLTVNPFVQAVATDLWNQTICLSDTLVPLIGTPIGGSWSGNGVSGFNFVPSATGVGTYILTYTYTGNNGTGCTSTDTTKVIVRDCGERFRLLSNDALILFPNPNNGRFNIKINSSLYNYLGMRVYNSAGMLVNGTIVNKVLTSPVYNGLTYGRVIPIDLSYLPAGVYLVKFYYDDGIRTSEKTFRVVIGHD
ncbi:MAG: immunoglobulin domain-containing protein [Chitinophagaceae bacterium]